MTAGQVGFGAGKAVAGGLLLGPLGLLVGFNGSKKMQLGCMNCGNQWQPKPPTSALQSLGRIVAGVVITSFAFGCCAVVCSKSTPSSAAPTTLAVAAPMPVSPTASAPVRRVSALKQLSKDAGK